MIRPGTQLTWIAQIAPLIVIALTNAAAVAGEPVRLANVRYQVPDTGVRLPPEPSFDDDCQELNRLSGGFKPLAEIELSLQPTADQVPPDCSHQVFSGEVPAATRHDSLVELNWEPTNFFHRPLYFDDVPLERYGQSVCHPLQPWVSGARFFLTIPVLPYKMGVDHPHDCITTLGLYRPGSCAPCTREVLLRGDRQAALLQAATTVGLVFLLP